MYCVMIENYTEATERRPMAAGEGCARGINSLVCISQPKPVLTREGYHMILPSTFL
jgi:hypothetical protein